MVFLFIICSCSTTSVFSQDTAYAKKCIQKLCDYKMHGRGYYKKGAARASEFILKEMVANGCESLPKGFFQKFIFPVNSIVKVPKFEINGTLLIPGVDYLVSASCPSFKKKTKTFFVVYPGNAEAIHNAVKNHLPTEGYFKYIQELKSADLILIDTFPESMKALYSGLKNTITTYNHTIFLIKDKLTWTVSTEQSKFASFDVLRTSFPGLKIYQESGKGKNAQPEITLNLKVKAQLFNTEQRNVVGIIEGQRVKDSFFVISAHYDHLGQMGKNTVFPGANDNAAGVAMLLDFVRYFKKHPLDYSIVFIAFAGEEAGLIGSHEYVQNPLHPLLNTRFLLNMDLVGTGETGMTVVNATVFERDFKVLDSLNKNFHLVPEIRKRGSAANSDHYFFTLKGIPSFFWYQSGPRTSYHDVFDVPETLSLAGYIGTFRLAVEYLQTLSSIR